MIIDNEGRKKQVKSKLRVTERGEVFTNEREVKAMLDLVKRETERIDSRFLEPACGDGNFLAEILNRKLKIVDKKYKKSQIEYERNAFLAVSSIYGIDIMEDNAIDCRERLFSIFNEHYTAIFGLFAKDECRSAVKIILDRNIIWGDALTLKTIDDDPKPIIFSEWAFIQGSMLLRRDFSYKEMIDPALSMGGLLLFSDLGEVVFIPEPVKEYSPIHFLKVADVE